MRVRAVAGGVAVSFVLTNGAAEAQTRELRWDPTLDVPITLVAGALWIATEAFRPELAPSACRWCEVDAVDLAARDRLVWSSTRTAAFASDVAALLAPAAAAGIDALAASREGTPSRVPVDFLLIAEAGVLAADLTQLTKLLTGRERPRAYVLGGDRKTTKGNTPNDNLSFFSGHTTETFVLAAATGTVATMRGYRWAPLAWTFGGALAAVTGYLRIAADEHWLTDVLVGMVVGAGVGFAVPYFFHRPASEPGGTLGQSGSNLQVSVAW